MLKLYPRGFYCNGHATVMSKQQRRLDLSTRPNENLIIREFDANRGVFDIFNNFRNGNVIISDFDLMAHIVAVIVDAFGLDDFQYWHAQQYQSEYFGQMHVDFIEDLSKYILTGSWNMPLYTWANILDRADVPAINSDALKEYTSTLLGKKYINAFNDRPISVVSVIGKMLEYPDGLDSVIMLAYILFCIKL